MNLYEFNKAGYASLPAMSSDRIMANTEALTNWIIDKTALKSGGRYWMILNHDIHYYTMYVWKNTNAQTFALDVVDLMQDLGALKSIEPTENEDAYEFWITGDDGETRMYLFFNYDQGVIEI